MSDHSIKIVIDPMGNSTVEAIGYGGVGCKDATKALEKALGADDGNTSTNLKGDFYESEDAGQQETVRSW